MIARIWHGWTTLQNADSYEDVLFGEVIPGIEKMDIKGFRSIEVLRRTLTDEVEFITIMHFDTLENIKAFTGDDYERAHVPQKARAVLSRFDDRSQHYEVKERREY